MRTIIAKLSLVTLIGTTSLVACGGGSGDGQVKSDKTAERQSGCGADGKQQCESPPVGGSFVSDDAAQKAAAGSTDGTRRVLETGAPTPYGSR